ncbi:MAG: ParB/RepB/Spo0J family partition protein, partial [Fibrobacter sp.]|nr:ParB/RepB/Spo0J family partition protein [Fibrobacter sp.]
MRCGVCPQGRSIRACRVFCNRHGIPFPGKREIDEVEALIERIENNHNEKGIEMKKEKSNENLRIINVASIDENDDNPRTRIENVEDLKASIKANGLLQPIVVRGNQPNKHWKVIAGSRRFKACKELGLAAIPCIVIEADDEKAYELATAENIVRENMTAVDEANAVQKLFAQGKSRTEIAAMFGKTARWAEGRRRIAELGGKAMEYLAAGKINLGHAEILTMCPSEDVEKWLGMAIWKSPEDLKNAIMNEKPLLERAPFDAKKICRHCQNRSDAQTDLFGDVTCCYCLDRECFNKQVAKHVESLRKKFIKEGMAEVPEDEQTDAMYEWNGYVCENSNDEDDAKFYKDCIAEGKKPMFWIEEKTAEYGFVFRKEGYDKEDDCADDDRNEDPDSWDWQMNHMDYRRREKVRKEASEEEKRIVADKLKGVFGNISNTAKAFILEALGRVYGDENGDTETYLKHQHDAADNFLDEVADHIVNWYKGVDDDVREFLEMDSREEFERNAAAAIPEDDAEEPDEDNLENEEE